MLQKIFRPKASVLLILTLVIFTQFVSVPAQAESSQFFGVRRSIATVIFCGLGGAVLGISTLSFYGDPQNHIDNITAGLALGIIAGGVYVASRDTTPLDPVAELNLKNQKGQEKPGPMMLTFNWDF